MEKVSAVSACVGVVVVQKNNPAKVGTKAAKNAIASKFHFAVPPKNNGPGDIITKVFDASDAN